VPAERFRGRGRPGSRVFNTRLTIKNHGGFFAIIARLINLCWFFFKWGLVLGTIGGVAAIPYFYRRVDEEIRRCLEERLNQHLHGLKATIGSAELVENEGIRVREVTIVEPSAVGPRAELLHVEEMFLHCRTNVQELLCQEPEVTRVTLRRGVLRITRRRDGTWSVSKLFPPPHMTDHPPEIAVENGTIEIFDPLKIPCSTLVLRDVRMTLGKPVGAPGADGAIRETRTVEGTLACDHFRRAQVRGVTDARGPGFSLSGDIEGLAVSPQLRQALPSPLAVHLPAIGELRGESDLSFRVAYDPGRTPALTFHAAGQLSRGRLDDPRLPHPLTEIRTKFHADNGGAALEELSARMNQAALRMAYCRTGYGGGAPLALQAEIRQLELDRQLFEILPPALQEEWKKYLPFGQIDADVKLDFDGRTWRPEFTMRLQDVSFAYWNFPCRLNRGQGELALKDDHLTLKMTAMSGNQPVPMTADIRRPFNGPTGTFDAEGKGILIDKELIDALHEKSREVVQSLDPRGTFDFSYHFSRSAAGDPPQLRLKIAMNGCSICYQKFSYPIDNITGDLEMVNHQWTFSKLEGCNGTAKITGSGSLFTLPSGHTLALNLTGKDVPLEPELRRALPKNIQNLWDSLQPRGMIDLWTDISFQGEQKKLSIGVRAEPQRETASITPVQFPYRMEKLQGTLWYRDGQFTLQRLKAEHGPAEIAAEGRGAFQPDGHWQLQLTGLTADRLPFDRDLIQALPDRLRKTVLALDPAGPINLRGNFDLFHSGRPGDPLQADWNAQIGLLQGRLRAGVPLENVTGVVALQGGFDGRHVRSRGELFVDSFHYKDYQLTQVRGPIWIDDNRVLLGRLVDDLHQPDPPPPANPPQAPRSLSAQLFGGTLLADGRGDMGSQPRYTFGASLSHASLARCALEAPGGHHNLQGDIMATALIRGTGATRNALSGAGKIHLSNADIYELPVMVSLLSILGGRPPDRNAFSTASIDYRIEGEHIYFDSIDFNGDAVSLLGKGDMDWQSNINLNFHTVIGRGDVHIPVIQEVREVFTGAGRGIMTLHVEGTLQDPQTQRIALPAVNQALQELQSRREEKKNR
jgi:hypothetical protein